MSSSNPNDNTPEATTHRRKRRLWPVWTVAGIVGIGGILYATALIMTEGNVPRGVTVGGVDVGSMSKDQAEARLRNQLAEGVRARWRSPPARCPPASPPRSRDCRWTGRPRSTRPASSR
ncbi:MAG: hypothetical protein L0J86_05990 [Corynebacterium sp.]|nr:hypothetical protein [Corynebacterium sp.]